MSLKEPYRRKESLLTMSRVQARSIAHGKVIMLQNNDQFIPEPIDESPMNQHDRVVNPDTSLCQVCTFIDLDTIVGISDQEREFCMGYIDDIINSPYCSLCCLIARSIHFSFRQVPKVDEFGNLTRVHLFIPGPENGEGRREMVVQLIVLAPQARAKIENLSSRPALKLLTADLEKVRPERKDKVNILGRRVPEYVDAQFYGETYRNCVLGHGSRCSHPKLYPNTVSGNSAGEQQSFREPRDLRLIDVNKACIVSAPPKCSYVALSYVWGKKPFLRLTRASHDRFREAGAFNTLTLPDTIQDAMGVVREIGETYLWVDSLCIVQDDMKDKDIQINQMDLVYSSAELTIVAADGENAFSGIPGIRRPRELVSNIDIVKGLQFKAMGPSFEDRVHLLPWYSRGWTYQELALSKRLLCFTKDEVVYLCGETVQGEGTMPEIPDQVPTSRKPRIAGYDMPASNGLWSCYKGLVSSFSSRDLSFESDINNAMSGLLSRFSTWGDESFICGLPETRLEIALIWIPHDAMQRRQPSASGAKFPTWSWIGWVGSVGYGLHGPDDIHSEVNEWILETPDKEQHPLFVDLNYSPDEAVLDADGQKYRGWRDGAIPLPEYADTCPAWQPSFWRKSSPIATKRRQKQSDSTRSEFTEKKREKDPYYLSPGIECGVLCFTTAAATLYLSPTLGLYVSESGDVDRSVETLCIYAMEGSNPIWIGYVMVEASIAKALEHRLHLVEVIVLSSCKSCWNPVGMEYGTRTPKAGLIYDEGRFGPQYHNPKREKGEPWLYNIMWISREIGSDGETLAIRKGIGQVHKEGWQLGSPALKNIRLG